MNPVLGTPEVSGILSPQYSPKPAPPAPPAPHERVAVIVNHGMGQQVPYETIEGVAKAISRGAGPAASDPVIRSVRLGTAGKDDVEPELVRAEVEVRGQGGKVFDVHVYESYWAPLTEGKVTASDVIQFLFNAGYDGVRNTQAKTYRRWMFGRERKFELPTHKLIAAFLGAMALLVALLIINAVATAAAASHAIGSEKPFPSGPLLVQLTWDFVIVDIAALMIGLGVFVFGRSRIGVFRSIGWIFIGLAALAIGVSAFFLLGHLAGWHWATCVTPGEPWARFVVNWSTVVFLLWVIEFWAASKVRGLLIQYVGDVAAYIAAHTVSKFWEVRQQIWKTAMRVSSAVYRARTAGDGEFLYNKIIVVGHSLGSVIGYDILNGLLLEDGFSAQPLNVAVRTRMFLTFGSPLDKTAFLFRTQRDINSQVRSVGAAAVQPMIQDYKNRPKEWMNLWSPADIISGNVDYYDPPTMESAKIKAHYMTPQGNPLAPDPRAVKNCIDPEARTPLAAHVEYWDGSLFASQLVRGITT